MLSKGDVWSRKVANQEFRAKLENQAKLEHRLSIPKYFFNLPDGIALSDRRAD